MGRIAHKPTETTRALVETLAAFGITEEAVGREVGVSEPTLRKHYRGELDTGTQRLIAKVANSLYRAATTPPWLRDKDGNVIKDDGVPVRDIWHVGVQRPAMFLLKTRGGWRENSPLIGVNGAPEGGEAPVVIVLPDNGRS